MFHGNRKREREREDSTETVDVTAVPYDKNIQLETEIYSSVTRPMS